MSVLLHQLDHAFPTDALVLLGEILVDTGTAVALLARGKRRTDQHREVPISGGAAIPAERSTRNSRSAPHRAPGSSHSFGRRPSPQRSKQTSLLVLRGEGRGLFRISRSVRNSRFSLRRRAPTPRARRLSDRSSRASEPRAPARPRCGDWTRSDPGRARSPDCSCPRRAGAGPPGS